MDRQLLLLGLLRQGDSHGYELHQFIEDNLSFCTHLKKPTAYYLLEKMEAKGWIAEDAEQVGNRPPRRVYRLLPAGEAAFHDMLRQSLSTYTSATFPGDVGVAFLDALEPADALACLADRRRALVDHLDQTSQAPAHSGSLQYVIDHEVRHLRLELEWLDELTARVEGRVAD
jgi:DNA-binding PadR family transcriptional regulator